VVEGVVDSHPCYQWVGSCWSAWSKHQEAGWRLEDTVGFQYIESTVAAAEPQVYRGSDGMM